MNYDRLAKTERPVIPWGWNTLRKIDREAARNRRCGTWDGFAKKVSPRTSEAAENAYIRQMFGNSELEFGEHIKIEELPELEAEDDSRAEWEEKPALPPELFIFTTTAREIAAQLFDEAPRISVQGTNEAKSSEDYDGGDIDDDSSVLEQEAEAAEAETDGERDGAEDVVDSLSENHLNENWLRNAYSELIWAYDQLGSDAKNELNRLYKRIKRALLNRARDEGITLRPNDFRKNRTYLLDVEEYDMFKPKFRDDTSEPPKKSFSVPKKKDAQTKSLTELLLCQLRQAKNK